MKNGPEFFNWKAKYAINSWTARGNDKRVALAISILSQQFIHQIYLSAWKREIHIWSILSMNPIYGMATVSLSTFQFFIFNGAHTRWLIYEFAQNRQPNWNSTNVHQKRTFHSFQLHWWSMAMHLSVDDTSPNTTSFTHKRTPERKKTLKRPKLHSTDTNECDCSVRVLFLLLLLLFHVYFDIIRLLIHFEFSAVLAHFHRSLSRIVPFRLFGSFVFHSIMSINICVCHWLKNGKFSFWLLFSSAAAVVVVTEKSSARHYHTPFASWIYGWNANRVCMHIGQTNSLVWSDVWRIRQKLRLLNARANPNE